VTYAGKRAARNPTPAPCHCCAAFSSGSVTSKTVATAPQLLGYTISSAKVASCPDTAPSPGPKGSEVLRTPHPRNLAIPTFPLSP